MADIELVIKIPENYYLLHVQNGSIASKIILNAVANGTPLPKGHGALMDKNAYMKSLEDRVQDLNNKDTLKNHDKIHGISMAYNICTRVPAIIQAERSDAE